MKKTLSTNQIMKTLFGTTGLGESHVLTGKVKKTVTKVKRYNPERYAEASAFIREDKYKAVAEAAVLNLDLLQMKARGEADSELIKKAKNAGSDLWRKIKELLGKLMIVIEEFFAKLFSKVKPLEKIQAKLYTQMNKLDKMVNAKSVETPDEKLKVEIPAMVNAAFNKLVSAGKFNKIETDVDSSKVYEATTASSTDAAKDLEHALATDVANFEASIDAPLQMSLNWFNMLKTSRKNKNLKNTVKTLGKNATTLFKGELKDLKTNLGNLGNTTANGAPASKIDTEVSALLAQGVNIEEHRKKLEVAKKKIEVYQKRYKVTFIYTISDQKSLVQLYRMCKLMSDVCRTSIDKLRQINSIAKEEKLFLNKIKNAPTSITGNMKPEILQIIRKVCQQANEALNINRKLANISAANVIWAAGKIVSASSKVLTHFTNEDEDDEVRIKA